MKSPEYRLTRYSPFEVKRSIKGGQEDEIVITFSVCFSTLRGKVAAEFRETT